MDTVLFGEVFAFTAIDIYTRESDVLLRPALEAIDGKRTQNIVVPELVTLFVINNGNFIVAFSNHIFRFIILHHFYNHNGLAHPPKII